VRIAPGSPAQLLLGMDATAEQIAAKEVEMGLDRPLLEQYWKYISDIFQGNFGTSLTYRTPVLPIILSKLPVTAKIAFATVFFGALVSIILGVIAGANRGKPIDFFVVAFALFGQAMATPWLAILLVYIFALKLNVLPSIGTGLGIPDYILPVATNVTIMTAGVVRLARSGMIDTLNEDYITATYAKGIRRSVVNWKYAFKNAMIPVVTLIGLQLGFFLAGVVVVETIFGMSGIGYLMYESVQSRDYPLLQSIVLICAFFIAVINFIVDIINASIDPRLTLE
jgi:peptide/nickel transport system permease protein